MIKRVLWLLVFCSCFIAPLGLAQDVPTIAILRFGSATGMEANTAEDAILDILRGQGYLSAEERGALNGRQDLMGERVNIIWGDAGFDFNNAVQMVNAALDKEADALLTISTPVTQIAVNATLDMDEPPAIIFVNVVNPFEAGIARSSCIKPAHVTGMEAVSPYKEILPLLLVQNPELAIIGTLFNPAEVSGLEGAAQIVEVGEALGLQVKQASVVGMADLRPATQSLVDKGVEIILLPYDLTTLGGFPVIQAVAQNNGIPTFHANIDAIAAGATVAAGFDLQYEAGHRAAQILTAYLSGKIDIATTGILAEGRMGVGVNLDSAAELGIEIADELIAMSSQILEEGLLDKDLDVLVDSFASMGLSPGQIADLAQRSMRTGAASTVGIPEGQLQEAMAGLFAGEAGMMMYEHFIARTICTDEMIAEQQAALDAMEG